MPKTLARTCALLALATSACVAPSASITPRAYSLEADGRFSGTSSGVSAFSDLETLGITEKDEPIGASAVLQWTGARLALSAVDTSFSGNGTATVDITLGGTTIMAPTAVFTQMDLALYTAYLTWDLIPTEKADLGLGFGLAVLDFDASVATVPPAAIASTSDTLPVPVVTGHAGTAWGDLALGGDVGLFEVEIDNENARVLDLDASLSWQFFDVPGNLGGSLVLGYRLIDIQADYEDDSSFVEVEMDVSGPYLGLSFSL